MIKKQGHERGSRVRRGLPRRTRAASGPRTRAAAARLPELHGAARPRAAPRVRALFDVDGQREEIHAFAYAAKRGGSENNRIAEANGDSAASLTGAASLEDIFLDLTGGAEEAAIAEVLL